jgi:hypothetical protein
MKKLFWVFFFLILLLGFFSKVIPLLGGNFYFTMDQGNDAVYIREILVRRQVLLRGPETGFSGLYTGPLWFYFISLGYALFGLHPFGAVFLLIVLNLVLSAILIWQIAKRVSPWVGLLIGASLQFFWSFYDTSRYAFNPFPLVFLSVLLILWLCDFFEGKKNRFLLAAIPVGVAFHCEVAAAVAVFLFYFLVGIWSIFQNRSFWKVFISGLFVVFLFFLPHLISELSSGFPQTLAFYKLLSAESGVFSGTRFQFMFSVFLGLLKESLIPQSLNFSLVFLGVIILIYIFGKKFSNTQKFVNRFIILSLSLFLVSWFWFGTNKGWQTWHTVFLPPLLFVSILLMILNLPRKIGLFFLFIILIFQLNLFKERYLEYLTPSADASLLRNELGAINWVYQKSEGKGFYVYSYLPSVYDYPYQYLFWWYGKKKYGFLPCEFSSFPGSPKLFVPGAKYYEEPKKECSNLRFLIIEPDKNLIVQNQWLEAIRRGTHLLEEGKVGNIKLEKRSFNLL